MKSKLLTALALACLCPLLYATTPVSGTVKTLGTTVAKGTFIRFWLRGCKGNQPRVSGVAIFPANVNGQFYFDIPADAAGTVTGTLYSTRAVNGIDAGEIECGGSRVSTWYGMQVFRNSVGGPEVPVHAKDTGMLDVSNVTPISTPSVTTAPTGDTTYLRLDGGNSPMVGTLSINGPLFANGPFCSVSGPLDVVACYGADSTGTNDSTAALNRAFSDPSNQVRYFPAGFYRISSMLQIDTRYKVEGASPQTSIFAAPGFNGTMANVVSTYAQASVVLGGMDGLFWDCRGTATVGVLYGGPNHSVSTFGYQTSNTVMHNCVTSGAQITDEAWELGFYNVGFQGNPGNGLQILDGFNMGENINCHSCDISNNGIGVVMGPSNQQSHDFFCYGCSFDFNNTWAIQNQSGATTGDSMVSLFGGHVETSGAGQKWFQNYNRMYISGMMLTEGASSAYPSYLIDNENYLVWEGGRQAPQGAPATLNPAQGGLTHCLAVIGLDKVPACSNFLSAGPALNNPGGLDLNGYISANRIQQPAASTFAGKCAMSTGTTCTFTTAAGFGNYLSYVTLDNASTPPATAIQAKCALSGTTATITAGATNSLTWDCMFVGNPN